MGPRNEDHALRVCLEHLRALEAVTTLTLRAGRQELSLATRVGRGRYRYEIKRGLNAARLEHLLLSGTKRSRAVRPLLLTDYLSPVLAKRVTEAGLDFVDEAGNMTLRLPGKLYIHIRGSKPKRPPVEGSHGVLSPVGLRLVFILLADKAAGSLTYRDLSDVSNLSLASVSRAMEALEQRGFVETRGRAKRLVRRKRELLELWVAGYAERLRPRLVVGRYRSPERDLLAVAQRFAKEAKERKMQWTLTGGLAAALLTGYYRGDDLTLFVDAWSAEQGNALRWMPSPDGPITVLQAFSSWTVLHALIHKELPVADPLLVYAELLARGRERELQAASMIRDRYLSHLQDDTSS